MRVALVHDWLTVPAGSEEVFAEICAMFPGTVFSSQIDLERCKFLQPYELRPSFVQKLPLALKKHYMYAPILPYVYARMNLSDFDLVLSDSHSFAHGVRKRPGALHINYYHTPARSLWVPEIDKRASKTALHRAVARRLKKLDLVASRRPDILLANSKTTAARIEEFYQRKVHKVIYPPVHTERWMQVERVSEDEGLLYWGRLIDYKKVDVAIEAVRKTGHRLNIVGSGPLERELKAQAAGMFNVVFHGRLSDEELMKLMGRCRAVVFAAYEDFGIVPVEAMAAGLPVVAFGEGGASETVTPEFGVQFKEQTPQSLVDALGELDRKRFEPESLKQHAEQFDIRHFKENYRATVEEAWANHRA